MHAQAPADAIAALAQEVDRYSPDRYPVQHATAQFHLGVTLGQAGRLEEAERALVAAAGLFHRRLPVECAKATNALGAVLREAGRTEEAARAFSTAADAFAAGSLPAEEGAARFNLGLVLRGGGGEEAARACFTHARRLFEEAGRPAQAGAAARELGTMLLQAGEPGGAAAVLAEAVGLADRGADAAGLAGAANALGLARLAEGDPAAAVEALRRALGASPRTVRPDAYAMVQANLALALERSGAIDRARLAARHALGAPGAAPPVRAQAAEVLERVGDDPAAVLAVLDGEHADRHAGVLRDELAWWLDAAPADRAAAARSWVEGQAARADRGPDLAAEWLNVVLELPPEGTERAIRAVLDAVKEADPGVAERFRTQIARALPRFHPPQWQRLEGIFDRIAEEVGVAWSSV